MHCTRWSATFGSNFIACHSRRDFLSLTFYALNFAFSAIFGSIEFPNFLCSNYLQPQLYFWSSCNVTCIVPLIVLRYLWLISNSGYVLDLKITNILNSSFLYFPGNDINNSFNTFKVLRVLANSNKLWYM